jgi:septal ring factor EnvC (AmiA/AmiB activator)
VDKLKEEIAMFDAQLSAQGEETSEAKEALMEARMEIDSINMEKKQLFQQWNSSLIGMRRRDEAHSAMNEALRYVLWNSTVTVANQCHNHFYPDHFSYNHLQYSLVTMMYPVITMPGKYAGLRA